MFFEAITLDFYIV